MILDFHVEFNEWYLDMLHEVIRGVKIHCDLFVVFHFDLFLLFGFSFLLI